MVLARSPLGVGSHEPVHQPVQFDHRHHAGDEGLDCRYCHDAVERSASAGLPPTSRCMGCHSQVWNESPLLEPVRASYFSGQSIPWNRVHRLPDFVFFNHSIHVNKGVGCVTCHGRVDSMPLVSQQAPLTMGWCLDCHRNPTPHLRPREAITSMTWRAPGDPAETGRAVQQALHVEPRTNCTTCHR
ncbi:cytochrome c3 family protein [Aggregicoccus sp. 17bor-14]|nr:MULTISPECIES: cytochrome c3 family protein [Myxococcaceae]MBF5046516.1 cytochrome c3 family protein [Simulacricoccus sp. 17bor-14]MRI92231.1 cytochrome c3 family protein [Aggregicoccus sp. 17bor-14]